MTRVRKVILIAVGTCIVLAATLFVLVALFGDDCVDMLMRSANSEHVAPLEQNGFSVHYRCSGFRDRIGWWVSGRESEPDDKAIEKVSPHIRALGTNFLILKGPGVTNRALASLEGVETLKLLDLGWTQIDDAGLKHLGKLKQLTELYLNNTRVTEAGISELLRLKNMRTLRGLNLSSTLVPRDKAMMLEKDHPGLGIDVSGR
jgi:hypothetical protein